MQGYFVLLLLVCAVAAAPSDNINVGPEVLDKLLSEKRYEEFDEYMGIAVPNLSKPSEGESDVHPMFHKGLFEGDIMPTPEQAEGRQGINFQKYRGSKWPGTVPYTISSDFSRRNQDLITRSINRWNSQVQCLKFNPRRSESAYVHFFPGNGCWAHLGRTGRQQSISLDPNGCMYQGTILHEMDHAAGVSHEQNRLDRDDFVEILWDNIPDEWKSQYEKNDPDVYGLQDQYDYYSVMHYPVGAPGTNKKAFNVRQNGIRENEIGNGNDLTQTDITKLRILYC